MNWTDITIEVNSQYKEAAQDIATLLSDGGIYIEDYADMEQQVWEIAHVDLIEQELLDKPKDKVLVHIYLAPDVNPAKTIELLQGKLLEAEVPYTLSTKGVKQEDWETAWKKYYKPIEIGGRLAVVPSWEEYKTDRTVLLMDPGMAFGTGTHETTLLCLEELDRLVKGGEKVLDIGTGSGILAVAALLLGANSALGIDIDPLCVRTAKENAQRNRVEKAFEAELGDLATKAEGPYEIITANIIADAIIRLAPDVGPLLAEKGVFLASGIIDTRADEVEKALEASGFKNINRREKNGWVLFIAGKPE